MKKYSVLFDDGESLIIEATDIPSLIVKLDGYEYSLSGLLSITVINTK